LHLHAGDEQLDHVAPQTVGLLAGFVFEAIRLRAQPSP
jgi:hypothetical protein